MVLEAALENSFGQDRMADEGDQGAPKQLMFVLRRPRPGTYLIADVDTKGWLALMLTAVRAVRLPIVVPQVVVFPKVIEETVEGRPAETTGPFPVGGIKTDLNLGGIKRHIADEQLPDTFVKIG